MTESERLLGELQATANAWKIANAAAAAPGATESEKAALEEIEVAYVALWENAHPIVRDSGTPAERLRIHALRKPWINRPG